MQDEPSTHGLNHEKLAKLWKMGQGLPEDHRNVDTDQDKAELLRDQLAESLPLDAGVAHLLPSILGEVCEKLKPFTGCSVKDLLTDSETDPLVAEAIKDIHKKQAESAPSECAREVATAIYYAAIASALVHQDTRITKFSYRDLGEAFARLRESTWLPSGLKDLIDEAHKICIQRVNSSKK